MSPRWIINFKMNLFNINLLLSTCWRPALTLIKTWTHLILTDMFFMPLLSGLPWCNSSTNPFFRFLSFVLTSHAACAHTLACLIIVICYNCWTALDRRGTLCVSNVSFSAASAPPQHQSDVDARLFTLSPFFHVRLLLDPIFIRVGQSSAKDSGILQVHKHYRIY